MKNKFKKPSWAKTQITRETGLLEDVCEHGVGHPNIEFLKANPKHSGVHGCDGCCSPKKKLTFGDLARGDRFIGFPVDGDNSGHGGYLGAHYEYMKIDPCYEKSMYEQFQDGISQHSGLEVNAVGPGGSLSHFPEGMFVIKIKN